MLNVALGEPARWVLGGIAGALLVATGAGRWLERRAASGPARATAAEVSARVRSWWLIVAVLGPALLTGLPGTLMLFAVVSWLALREFLALAPPRPGDHRALLYAFYVVTPLQYAAIWLGWDWLFVALAPVFAGLWLPARAALAGDPEGFTGRAATLQWGLLLCVYALSHVPALVALPIPGFAGRNAELALYLILVVQASDVLQYCWGKLLGGPRIAPGVSPNKTWAGFLGGVGSATLLGTALWWLTPFQPWQAAAVSLAIALAGFAGGLVMSAIKRDRGVKDFGALLAGHGGILDRVDSLLFAAPLFYYAIKVCWT